MSRDLLDLVRELNTLNDDNLADRVIENSDVQWCLSELQDILEEMPTLTPPNEPLTLEQLREMDGEPVWIVDVWPHKWYGPGWAIVDRDNCLVRTAKNWNPVFFERYGERWLAFHRPPEGEEGDADRG